MKKIIFTIIGCLMISCFVCCGDNGDPQAANNTADTVVTEEETIQPETTVSNDLPETDLEGKTLTFILRTTPDDWSADDFVVER